MTLINYKVELKLRWKKYYVLSAAGNDNLIILIMIIMLIILIDTKLYVPVVPVPVLSIRDNQKLSKLLSKEFERSVNWNEYKTKVDNKNTTNECRYFLESSLVGISRLFVLVYSGQDASLKRFKIRKYYLPKDIIKNYNAIINRKNFYDQAIDSGIKWHKDIRKLTTGQGEDYTTGCLLDYDYIKNHYRLIAIDLIRQKELDVDPKATQQTKFVGQLKNADDINAHGTQPMSVLTMLEKIKETRLKLSQGNVTVL